DTIKFELNLFDSGTPIENLPLEKFMSFFTHASVSSCNLHRFIQFLIKLSYKESLKLILTPENTIYWYEQGARDTWTSKISDKLVEQAVKEKNTFKEPEANLKDKFFWHNLSQWNSGLKSTEQFLNLSVNVEHIKKQKKEEDIHKRFFDNIKKLKSNDKFYEITTINNKTELLNQKIINNCHDAILEMNLVNLPPNHPLKSWHAIKFLIPLNTYLQAKNDFDALFNFNFMFNPPEGVETWIDSIWDNEIEEVTRPDLNGVDERFFKNSVEELFKLIDKCQKQNLKEINEATWLQMLYPQIDAAVADFAQLIPQNTSNSLSQLIGSDESRKPDYTVFCITKDNPSLEFAALFLEGAKPVKKDELGDRKSQLDKERLQSIIKLYFDYILARIQSNYGEFLTRELSKEILAIPLITMQATGTELIISISDQQALPLIRSSILARITIPYYKGVNAEERFIQKIRAKNLVLSMWIVRKILKMISDHWSRVIKKILESKEASPEHKINLINKKARYMSFEFGKHAPVK
ncbi:8423_t:CDS:2, partial [Dentiscutata erythropus]